MGRLVGNYVKRETELNLAGQKITKMVTLADAIDLPVVRVNAGRDEGSKADGSVYTTVYCSPEAGKSVQIVGYGEDNASKLATLKPGDLLSAVLEPMSFSNGYRVKEFAPTQVFAVPEPVPATEEVA